MEVRLKESTQGVDNLYKHLINKDIYIGLTKLPEISAICLVDPLKTASLVSVLAIKLSPAAKKTIKSYKKNNWSVSPELVLSNVITFLVVVPSLNENPASTQRP